MYDKSHPQNAAVAVHAAFYAVKDGVGVEDTGAAINLFTAIAACADEFKSDPDAAGLHFVSKLADLFGDDRMNRPEEVTPETPTEG